MRKCDCGATLYSERDTQCFDCHYMDNSEICQVCAKDDCNCTIAEHLIDNAGLYDAV